MTETQNPEVLEKMRAVQREYKRAWLAKEGNREKQRRYNEKYWLKKVAEMEAKRVLDMGR